MIETNLLLKCYYETLYELLDEQRNALANRIRSVLAEQVKAGGYKDFFKETFDAYEEACMAFIEERIELYNPVGIQYMYSRERRDEAFQLEMQLDWYDSRKEFQELVEAARLKADFINSDYELQEKAMELVKEAGAFPDKSIIACYRAKPELKKLPDYVIALVIEENIKHVEFDE
jgi:hypothetical protein